MEIACFKCLLFWRSELLRLLNGDHPEAGHCLVVMALTLAAVTFDEWSGAEVLQARSRSREGLATSTMANSGVLE